MPEEVKERLMGRLRSIEKAKKGGFDEGLAPNEFYDYHEEEIRMAKQFGIDVALLREFKATTEMKYPD